MSNSLDWGKRTYIMGILNLTPDSFSGDGLIKGQDWLNKVIEQAKESVLEGADILDLGAESSRPGATPISEDEELERLMPALSSIIKEDLNVILSVDTYKSRIAEAALSEGAQWINDIWGFKSDSNLADVVARYKATAILMHNRKDFGKVAQQAGLGTHYVNTIYKDIIEEVKQGLLESIEIAKKAGISEEKIILDPGIGFGKNVEQNLELLNRLDEIKALNYPMLVGPSRKSFIGYTLNLPVEERLEGTAAAAAISIARRVDIIRVHDVKFMVRLAQMSDAIVRKKVID